MVTKAESGSYTEIAPRELPSSKRFVVRACSHVTSRTTDTKWSTTAGNHHAKVSGGSRITPASLVTAVKSKPNPRPLSKLCHRTQAPSPFPTRARETSTDTNRCSPATSPARQLHNSRCPEAFFHAARPHGGTCLTVR